MHPDRLLRLVSFIEAGTWALLLGSILARLVWVQPAATLVTWAGSFHGAAFIAYLFALVTVASWAKWPVWGWVLGAAASIIPFATLLEPLAHRRLPFAPRGWTRLADWVSAHPLALSCSAVALLVFVLGHALGH